MTRLHTLLVKSLDTTLCIQIKMHMKINQLRSTRVSHNSIATAKHMAIGFPIELEFRKLENSETLPSKEKKEQTPQTSDAESGIHTQGLLSPIGGRVERSHLCASVASPFIPYKIGKVKGEGHIASTCYKIA